MSDLQPDSGLDPRLQGRERVLAQIEIWRKELVNLARSNRLLHFKDTRSSTLGIVVAEDETAAVVDRLLEGRTWSFFMPPEEDEEATSLLPELPGPNELITDKTDRESLARTLRNLDRRATQEYMDKGLWILYLAAGMLSWVDPDTEEEAKSPLVLIPVALERDNPREPFRLRRADEEIVVNPALTLKLAEFGFELPSLEDPDELVLDDFLDQVRTRVGARRGWSVARRLVVSHFSFHKEVMYRDLEANVEEIADHPLIQALVLGASEGSEMDFEPLPEGELDERGKPDNGATVLPADATQRQCIDAAVNGHSFVMDGPPGTGKSQTIANMIAENIASGRTVLFVSEKAAALEVVETRMRQVGLGDYTIELHSHKATRKEVAHELGRALTHHPQSRAGMPSAELAVLAQRRLELSRRAAAANEIREPLGRSLFAAIGRIAQLQNLPQAPHPIGVDDSLSAATFAEIISGAERIARAWGPVERGEEFIWRDLGDIRLDSATQQRITEEVRAGVSALDSLVATGSEIADELGLDPPQEMPEFRQLQLVLEHCVERPQIKESWLSADDFPTTRQLFDARRGEFEDWRSTCDRLLALAGNRYRSIDSGLTTSFRTAVDGLETTPLGNTAQEMQHEDVMSLLAATKSWQATLGDVLDAGRVIAHTYSLPQESMTITRATELAELGLLSGAPDRPEASWIEPGGLAEAQHARDVLEPLVRSFRHQRTDGAGQVFTDGVLELDLDGLITRFETVHHGMAKLRSPYRDDKRTVASVSHAGKFTKSSIAALHQARQWQTIARELKAVEERNAGQLGKYYYRQEDTDFESLNRALAATGRALELAGRGVSVSSLQGQLARESTPSVDLQSKSRWLAETMATWKASARDSLGDVLVGALDRMSLEDGDELLSSLSSKLSAIGEILSKLDRITDLPLSIAVALNALEAREELERLERSFEAAHAQDQQLLGDAYLGTSTDWEALGTALEWAGELRDLLEGGVDDSAAARILSTEIVPAELSGPLGAWREARDQIASNFADQRGDEVKKDLMTTVRDTRELLDLLAQTVGDIEEWFDFAAARRGLNELGVGESLDFCEAQRVEGAAVTRVIERAVLERWADAILQSDAERIGPVRAEQLESIVEEFRRLDEEVIEFAAARVIQACNERRPRTTLGAAGVIQREGQKQRKHMPVRRLLDEAGPVALALKPCFMMTPLTVSQFLPPGFRFDVVIFDEASQVRPSDAVNCIYRGDQLIVAGDEQQLPPTSFFEVSMAEGDDEYEEDQFDEFESILKLCQGAGGIRLLPLRWHYRSQHEDLILYSNYSFYEGRLVSFPGAVHDGEDLGVAFIHVPDGVYRRGTSRDNPREAKAVVERVLNWAEWSLAHPDREVTLGVVAFSEAQASAIEAELDRQRQERPDLDAFFQEGRLDGYFIKNLENVQGDERDVMIFSVGYGRDENGKFTMNFGPVNRSGGRRRLNVAITRARRRVEVVSSVRAEDFHGEMSAEGVRHLKRYLDFAARGQTALSLEVGDTELDAESPFEEEVIRVIRSWGYDAVPQVGAAGYRVDIGVRHPTEPGRYALGVECDGAMYHSSRVARDRDRMRQQVLEGLGWRLHRIWGTAWYRDRASQEQRLREAIEAGIAGEVPVPRRRRLDPAPDWTEDVYEVVAPDDRPSWAEIYAICTPEPPSSRKLQMHDLWAQADLRRMIEEVVATEGPISRELVLRRIREAWGVGRAGSRIRDAFDKAVRTLKSRGSLLEPEKGQLMLEGADPNRVRIPDAENPATRRSIDEVPSTELRTAIEYVVRDAMQVSRDELTQAVARLYGWNRRGREIGAALDRAITYLLRMKRLARDGSYLRIPS
jgi:hypothetical protein